MADDTTNEYTVVNQKQEKPKEKTGLMESFAFILVAIANNISSGGLTEMVNLFRMLFRSFLATLLVIGGGWFLWQLATTKDAELNKYAGVIIGFVTASVIGVAVGFYFGGQDRSKKPNNEGIKPIE